MQRVDNRCRELSRTIALVREPIGERRNLARET